MIIIAVSGWRGFVGLEDQGWISQQIVQWGTALHFSRAENVFWRVGDEKHGADSAALKLFQSVRAAHCVYEADWSLPNGAGGPVRSQHMLTGRSSQDPHQHQLADYLLAFPQPGKRLPKHEEVSGTWRCVEMAKKRGITVIIPGYTKLEPERLF